MSNRLALGCVVLAIVGWSGVAAASLTSSVDPIEIGDVAIGASQTVQAEAQSDTTDVLDHFHLGGDCAGVTVAPTTDTLPHAITDLTPMSFDATFAPAARGAVTCTVAFHTAAHVSIGTDFTITANGLGPAITAPASVAFASRRVDHAAVLTDTQDVVIGNAGETALTIEDLAISGDFTLASPPTPPVVIPAGESLTLKVVFDPSAPGARAGTLDITSDDPATPSVAIDLSGAGTSAVIAVTDAAFGVVALTQTVAQNLSVTNTVTVDAGPLTLRSATIDGGDGWFTFAANGAGCGGKTVCTFGAGVVAPQSITVRCTPPADGTGVQTATVTFDSDTDDDGDAVAGLTCTAGRADASVDPTALDFGATVAVGATVQRTVTVSNDGTIDLTYTASTIGPRRTEYTLGGCATSCTVAPGESQAFTLTFQPTQAGGAAITVNVASNDPDDATIAIPVSATSVAPALAVQTAPVFGNVEVETTKAATLTIENTGTADLAITSADLTTNDGSYAVTAGATGAQTVAPGATASWTLTCTPATRGGHAGKFTIASDALGDASHVVNLACTGTEGVLVTQPTSIDFGGVSENAGPVVRSFVLRNAGNLAVSDIAAVLDPDDVGYDLDPATPVPAQLAAGAQVTINARFTPTSADDGGPATVTFSGTFGATSRALRVPPVLALDGDGLTTGFDVSPGAIDFGELRFDTSPSRTFCILNTSEAAVTINTITITPDAGTSTGEFAVTTIRRRTCGTAGGTAQTLPAVLAVGDQLEVTVVADPADRTGPLAATLTVTSTSPVLLSRDVTLTATSTSGALTLTPGATLDFGPRDVQGAPATLDLVIANTGDAPLDLRNFARDDDGANAHFALDLPADQTLAPGDSLTIPVTYAPAVVTAPDEQIVLSHQVVGSLNDPATSTIVIRGAGIDRTLELSAAPDFPPTFRNPGSAAPVRAVTVRNAGAATLQVSAVMLTDADPAVWTLVNADPVDVPGSASVDLLVRFAPTAIGPSTATLVITSDDDANPGAEVALTGTGIDRDVAFGAPKVDLGFTAVGVPVTIDDALLVASMNPTTGFTIAKIELSDPDPACVEDGMVADPAAFAVVDAQGVELPPSTNASFGLTFTPSAVGRIVASADLFVDEDPVPQARICVTGTAVFVDAHGGGGCAAGGGVGGAGAVVLIAGAALLATRRRRRVGVAVGLALGLGLGGRAARADNVVLSVFDPTPSTQATNFQLSSPEVGAPGDWVITAIVSHATNPLVLDAFADGQFLNDQRVVERSTMLELGAAYALLDRLELGARMPFYSQDGQPFGDPSQMFTTDPASGAATGDLTLHAKLRLWRGHQATFGAMAQLTLPTATDGELTGTDMPSGRVLALGALVPDTLQRRITLSGQLGAVVRARSRFMNLEQGGGATWGLGVSVRALDRVWVAAEVYGDVLPSARTEQTGGEVALSPIEWLAGLRWRPDRRVAIGLAAGRGLTSSAGSPELRGVLSLAYTPGAPAIPSLRAIAAAAGGGDRDRDGVVDAVDRCPREPEDRDLFDDTDGCPDPDNDGDGIADTDDGCPLDVEDQDGFDDGDGCPDRDNDSDGLPDDKDQCPSSTEDKDGFEDLDGCPELDNDHDGVLDRHDRCPNEPETINGNQDDDGCADRGDSAVVVSPDRIDTLEAIQFIGNGTRLQHASYNVLGQVAATMRAHPEILRVRVTAHVQASSNPRRDQQLSDKRADVIRDWLIQWGLEPARVEARGFGGTKPLVPPGQRGAAAVNTRVELIIMERK